MSELTAYVGASRPSGIAELEFLSRADFSDLKSIVVMPVAAHQEDIEPTLDAYRQVDTEGSGLFLFLNAPADTANSLIINQNVQSLERATGQKSSPVVGGSLRLYDWGGEDGSFSMGKVRRDGWLHFLEPALAKGLSETAIGFSHDADMLAVSKNLFRASQAVASERPAHFQYVTPYWALSDAEADGKNLPAINRLSAYLTISEEAFRMSTKIHRMWDWAVGFKLESYALSGGYQASSAHTETEPIVTAIKGKKTDQLPLFSPLVGEFVVASMRRFAVRASQGESPFDIMDPSIGANDDLRYNALPIPEAEKQTRANLIDWCRKADGRNIASIIASFSEEGDESVDLRIGFYQDLANHGRLLLKRYGRALNGLSAHTPLVTRDIVGGMHQKSQEILTGSR
jgi:hypothetical protein